MPELFAEQNVKLENLFLRPVTTQDASHLSKALAAIKPWSTLCFSPTGLASYLTRPDPSASRYTVLSLDSEEIVGTISIRSPWLRGPYLELLAILPAFQGRGMGHELLTWLEEQARGPSQNIWVITSNFNSRAISFYEKNGFETATELQDLVRPGFDEVLMRKQIGEIPASG